jgi:hypothetical protein
MVSSRTRPAFWMRMSSLCSPGGALITFVQECLTYVKVTHAALRMERLRQTGLRQKCIVASAARGLIPIRTQPLRCGSSLSVDLALAIESLSMYKPSEFDALCRKAVIRGSELATTECMVPQKRSLLGTRRNRAPSFVSPSKPPISTHSTNRIRHKGPLRRVLTSSMLACGCAWLRPLGAPLLRIRPQFEAWLARSSQVE